MTSTFTRRRRSAPSLRAWLRAGLFASLFATLAPMTVAAQSVPSGDGPQPRPLIPDSAWLSGRNAHLALGLGTLALIGLTAVTAPDDGGDCEQGCTAGTTPRRTSGTAHTRLGRAASVFAAATVTTGLVWHWNDFHLEDGLSDPDNQHVLLGLGGALLMMAAVNRSMHSTVPTQHAGTAAAGGVAMAAAIKLTW
ncbi:hypothetical protein ACWA7J_00215 [Leptothrix sp. BB-4]